MKYYTLLSFYLIQLLLKHAVSFLGTDLHITKNVHIYNIHKLDMSISKRIKNVNLYTPQEYLVKIIGSVGQQEVSETGKYRKIKEIDIVTTTSCCPTDPMIFTKYS